MELWSSGIPAYIPDQHGHQVLVGEIHQAPLDEDEVVPEQIRASGKNATHRWVLWECSKLQWKLSNKLLAPLLLKLVFLEPRVKEVYHPMDPPRGTMRILNGSAISAPPGSGRNNGLRHVIVRGWLFAIWG